MGRYVSIESIIEDNRERYYETLELSSDGWHEGKHDPWPCINYLLFSLKTSCKEFEERMGRIGLPRGEKTQLILSAIEKFIRDFSVADIQKKCPSVGIDMIRRILKKLKSEGRVECLGRGRTATWRRIG